MTKRILFTIGVILLMLIFNLLFMGPARADTIDVFTFAIPNNTTFVWALPSDACCGVFTFGSDLVYVGSFSDDAQNVYFACMDPRVCGTDYWEHFSQPIFDGTAFVPGTYQNVFGFTDNWSATLTITDPTQAQSLSIATPEPSTGILVLVIGGIVVCLKKLWTS